MANELRAVEQPKARSFSISGLHMDLTNPRFEQIATTEKEAINYMFDVERKRTLALARDIAARGMLNPTELPIVVETGNRRLVVEGNRRLACLKALNNPKLLTDEKLQRRFRKLVSDAEVAIPRAMQCVPFGSRDDANYWIQLRHTGVNGGVGVAGWSSAQANRFQARVSGKQPVHVQFVDLVRNWYAEDDALLADLSTAVDKHFSTMRRVLATKEVRDRVGLDFEKGQLRYRVGAERLRPFVAAFLRDLSTKRSPGDGWSRVLHSQADRVKYIEGFGSKLPDLTTALKESESVSSTQPAPVEVNLSEDEIEALPANRGEYAPPAPVLPAPTPVLENRLFYGVDFAPFGPRLQQLGENSKRIDISHSFDVAGVMARVLVDLCTTQFLERHADSRKDERELWKRIRAALLILDREVTNEKSANPLYFEILKNIDNAHHGLAVRTMNTFVHSSTERPSAGATRHLSQLFTPMLVAMSDNLGQTE